MVVLHDFTPCVDDELEVKRGQIVNILYRENDWVYVIGKDTRQEGFIPHSYCAPYNTELANLAIKKKLPREAIHDESILSVEAIEEPPPGECSMKHSLSLNSEPDFLPFQKDPSGRYIVLYTFIARDENDVSVERGEFVTVLNREDPEWFWIVRSDGQEGFIPSGFVYPADTILQGQTKPMPAAQAQAAANQATLQVAPEQQHGTELIMLYDFKAQAPDDLSVRRGDWIYADLNNQTVDGWLWSYSPKTRKYGFIPKAYARPLTKPLTSL